MKTINTEEYHFEDIREFLIRRPWLRVGKWGPGGCTPEDEYQGIKARILEIPEDRAKYLRAFIDGWRAEKA